MKIFKFVAVGLIALSVIACKKESKKTIEEEVQKAAPVKVEEVKPQIIDEITLDQLKSLGNDIQLVDVRTPDEFAKGYIKNAINIDVKGNHFVEGTVLLDKTKPVYVYCMAGVRSARAAVVLEAAGFSKIYEYKGGFKEWAGNGNIISLD